MKNENLTRRSFGKLVAAGTATLALPSIARAQTYPAQILNVVVPLATGGLIDRIARAMSEPLGAELGQRVIVANRPGAGTQLGNTYFLQQPDDGYTLLCTTLPPLILTKVGSNAPYSLDDFTPINVQSRDFAMVTTTPAKGIKSMDEVLERLKTNPSGLSIGLQPSSVDLVNLALLCEAAGVDRSKLRLITYDGAGPVRNAVLGGHVDIGIVGLDGFITIKDRVVPLAVFADQRSPFFPDTQTIVEFGEKNAFKPEHVDGAQRGWVVHTSFKTKHPDRYERLVSAFEKVTTNAEFRASMKAQELESDWTGPEKSDELYKATIAALSPRADLLKAG